MEVNMQLHKRSKAEFETLMHVTQEREKGGKEKGKDRETKE